WKAVVATRREMREGLATAQARLESSLGGASSPEVAVALRQLLATVQNLPARLGQIEDAVRDVDEHVLAADRGRASRDAGSRRRARGTCRTRSAVVRRLRACLLDRDQTLATAARLDRRGPDEVGACSCEGVRTRGVARALRRVPEESGPPHVPARRTLRYGQDP